MTISIHPPRAERDGDAGKGDGIGIYFNPPAPCGAGLLQFSRSQYCDWYFNPPAPCGAGPIPWLSIGRCMSISIHPPRAGRDASAFLISTSCRLFQSTRPVRGGTYRRIYKLHRLHSISIHPPRAGRDCTCAYICPHFCDFNPPAPCGAGLVLSIYH